MTKEDNKLPPAEYLRECFSYDPETGSLKWRERPESHFLHCRRGPVWEAKRRNALSAGKEFGVRNTHGHIRGGLDGELFYAHRIIWKMVYGEEPLIIDHRDGDTANNRLLNLLNGDRAANQRNQKLSTTNTSGSQGVYLHKQSGGWYARIQTPLGNNVSFYSKERGLVEAWRRDREIEFGYSGRASA